MSSALLAAIQPPFTDEKSVVTNEHIIDELRECCADLPEEACDHVKEFVDDRTNWRAMLKGPPEPVDLRARRDRLIALLRERSPQRELPGEAVADAEPVAIQFPVLEYPEKIVSHDLGRKPLLEGTLLGIKGQYLIFDAAVLNVRRYGGYCLSIG